eukprot:TRINITY_DN112369_c0_g1_i1.p1 TRINITY_DN112369_c0_g1~~TRINITY_DN112369_c0_g1_i1.p1  ORF type:complete len:353 (+),score=80.26 TRINITY_DN112369_c0_g1_i1:150-1208(+)
MAKGEYEFPILVTCLLILGLQIHNPFQKPAQCHCDGSAPALGRAQDDALAAGHIPQQAAATAYRPAQQSPMAPPSGGSGMSTDALLRELDAIQGRAKEQQDTLAAAGRMPPPSPILQHLRDVEGADAPGSRARSPSYVQQQPAVPPQVGVAAPATGYGMADASPALRRRDEFGRFLEARQPRGLGIVLGVGRGDFAVRLLNDWQSAQGVYLVDPFIHQWRGYDDPANLQDADHQKVFEELRQRLYPFEGRHVLVRDFAHSFAATYKSGGTATGLPTFVYIDANHGEAAIAKDIELWWPLVAPGGILAGSSYFDDGAGKLRVRSVVDKFAASANLRVSLTQDDSPPSWFIVKP